MISSRLYKVRKCHYERSETIRMLAFVLFCKDRFVALLPALACFSTLRITHL